MENPDEVMDLESQQTPPPDADDSHITGSRAASPEYGDVELQRTAYLSPASPQVSEEVHASVEDGGGGGGGGEAKQQHADLESGPRDNRLPITRTPAPSFFELLKKSCKSYNIFLLFISAVLSIGFGIMEKGIGTGWVEGAILMDAAITLVILSAMREFWYGNTQHQARTPDHAQLMAEIDTVCTWIQTTGLVFFIAVLAISFLHFMLEREDSNSGLAKITASTEIINVIENVFMKQSGSKSILVLLLPAVLEKIPFCVALAISLKDKSSKFEGCNRYTIQKYIQPEITMNIAFLLITLIAICMGQTTITTIQSFWVEMVVTLPAGFALLMEPPTEEQPPPTEEQPPPTEEQPTEEQPPPTEEQPTEEQPPPTEEQPPPTEEQPTEEQPTEEQPPPTEEQPPPTEEQPTEEQPPPTEEQPPPTEEQPTEEQPPPTEEQPPPAEEQPPPVRGTKGPIISNPMWRNILIQVAYQIAMSVTLQLKGKTFPGINKNVSDSMVFNAFVLCQVFNQINARQPQKKNVFRGILLHRWFLVSLVFALTLQLSFIEIAHILVGNARLNWEEWGVCLLIGMASWPIDLAGKCASDVIKKVRDPPPSV